MTDCIFCKIIEKKIPSKMVYEDDKVFAFDDINPQAPVHILIIPKQHVDDVTEVKDFNMVGYIYSIANMLAEQKGIANSGYRVVLNMGPDAGMAVHHLHFHLLGGRALHWPPG